MLPDSTSSIEKTKKRKKTVSFALDSIDGVPINQTEKVHVKSEKKKKVTRKKKVVKKRSDDELDLDREMYPLTHYIKNKSELVNQMFETIKTEKIKSLLPEVLKKYTISEIRQLCSDEVEIMSKKRILGVLNGKRNEDISSSGTEDDSDNEDKNIGNQPDSTSTESMIEDELASVRPQSVSLAIGATNAVDNVNQTSLEILELEMRARAIKKMLDKQVLQSQSDGGENSELEEGEYTDEDERQENSDGIERDLKQEQLSPERLIKTEPVEEFTSGIVSRSPLSTNRSPKAPENSSADGIPQSAIPSNVTVKTDNQLENPPLTTHPLIDDNTAENSDHLNEPYEQISNVKTEKNIAETALDSSREKSNAVENTTNQRLRDSQGIPSSEISLGTIKVGESTTPSLQKVDNAESTNVNVEEGSGVVETSSKSGLLSVKNRFDDIGKPSTLNCDLKEKTVGDNGGVEVITDAEEFSAITQVSTENTGSSSVSRETTQTEHTRAKSMTSSDELLTFNNSEHCPNQSMNTTNEKSTSVIQEMTTLNTSVKVSDVPRIEAGNQRHTRKLTTPRNYSNSEDTNSDTNYYKLGELMGNEFRNMEDNTSSNTTDVNQVDPSRVGSERTSAVENKSMLADANTSDKVENASSDTLLLEIEQRLTEQVDRGGKTTKTTPESGPVPSPDSVEVIEVSKESIPINLNEDICRDTSKDKSERLVDLELTRTIERAALTQSDDDIGCIDIDLNDDESLDNLDLDQRVDKTSFNQRSEKSTEPTSLRVIQSSEVTGSAADTALKNLPQEKLLELTESDKIADELMILVEKKIIATAQHAAKLSQNPKTADIPEVRKTVTSASVGETAKKKYFGDTKQELRTPPRSRSASGRSRSPVSRTHSRRSYTPPTQKASKRHDDRKESGSSSTDRRAGSRKGSRDRNYHENDTQNFSNRDDRRLRNGIDQRPRQSDRYQNQHPHGVDRSQRLPYHNNSSRYEQRRIHDIRRESENRSSDSYRRPDPQRQPAHDRQSYSTHQRHASHEQHSHRKRGHYQQSEGNSRDNPSRRRDDYEEELDQYKQDARHYSHEDSHQGDKHSYKRSHSDQKASQYYEKRDDGYYRRREPTKALTAQGHGREEFGNMKARRLSEKRRKEPDSPKPREPPHTRLGNRIVRRGMRADNEPVIRGVVLSEPYYSDEDRVSDQQPQRLKQVPREESPPLESDDDIIEIPLPVKSQEVVELLDSD